MNDYEIKTYILTQVIERRKNKEPKIKPGELFEYKGKEYNVRDFYDRDDINLINKSSDQLIQDYINDLI